MAAPAGPFYTSGEAKVRRGRAGEGDMGAVQALFDAIVDGKADAARSLVEER